jgi:hypothetical protein
MEAVNVLTGARLALRAAGSPPYPAGALPAREREMICAAWGLPAESLVAFLSSDGQKTFVVDQRIIALSAMSTLPPQLSLGELLGQGSGFARARA